MGGREVLMLVLQVHTLWKMCNRFWTPIGCCYYHCVTVSLAFVVHLTLFEHLYVTINIVKINYNNI